MNRVKRLAFSAVMASISVIMSRFLALHIPMAGMETMRFGMGGLPLILTGLAMGTRYGAATGAVADLIGMAVFPHGPYFPHFTLTAALTGFIPGFFNRLILPGKKRSPQGGKGKISDLFWPLLGIVTLTQGTTTCFLVPFFLSGITGQPFMVLWLPRIIVLAAEAPFFAYVLSKVLPGVSVSGHRVFADEIRGDAQTVV